MTSTRQADSRIKVSVFCGSSSSPSAADPLDVLSTAPTHYYFPAAKEKITIGRGGTSDPNAVDIVLSGSRVLSKAHVSIISESGKPQGAAPPFTPRVDMPLDFSVVDLGSANGTALREMVVTGFEDVLKSLGVLRSDEAKEIHSVLEMVQQENEACFGGGDNNNTHPAEDDPTTTPPRIDRNTKAHLSLTLSAARLSKIGSSTASSLVANATQPPNSQLLCLKTATKMFAALAHAATSEGEGDGVLPKKLIRAQYVSPHHTTVTPGVIDTTSIIPPKRLTPQVPQRFDHGRQAITIGKYDSVAIIVTDLFFPAASVVSIPQAVTLLHTANPPMAGVGSAIGIILTDNDATMRSPSTHAFNGTVLMRWQDLFMAGCTFKELAHSICDMHNTVSFLEKRVIESEEKLTAAIKTIESLSSANKALSASSPQPPTNTTISVFGSTQNRVVQVAESAGSATPVEQSPQQVRFAPLSSAHTPRVADNANPNSVINSSLGTTLSYDAGVGGEGGIVGSANNSGAFLTGPSSGEIASNGADSRKPNNDALSPPPPALPPALAPAHYYVASHMAPTLITTNNDNNNIDAVIPATLIVPPLEGAGAEGLYSTGVGIINSPNNNNLAPTLPDPFSDAVISAHGGVGCGVVASNLPNKFTYEGTLIVNDDSNHIPPPPPQSYKSGMGKPLDPALKVVYSDSDAATDEDEAPPPPAFAPYPNNPPNNVASVGHYGHTATTSTTTGNVSSGGSSSIFSAKAGGRGHSDVLNTLMNAVSPQAAPSRHNNNNNNNNNNNGNASAIHKNTNIDTVDPPTDVDDDDEAWVPPPSANARHAPPPAPLVLPPLPPAAAVVSSTNNITVRPDTLDDVPPPPRVQPHENPLLSDFFRKPTVPSTSNDDDDTDDDSDGGSAPPPPMVCKSGRGAPPPMPTSQTPATTVARAAPARNGTPASAEGVRANLNNTAVARGGKGKADEAATDDTDDDAMVPPPPAPVFSKSGSAPKRSRSPVRVHVQPVGNAAPSVVTPQPRDGAKAGNARNHLADDSDATPPLRNKKTRGGDPPATVASRLPQVDKANTTSDDDDAGDLIVPPPRPAAAAAASSSSSSAAAAPSTQRIVSDPLMPPSTTSVAPTTAATYVPGMYVPAGASKQASAVPSAENSSTLPAVAETQKTHANAAAIWQFKTDLRKANKNDLAWTSYNDSDSAVIEAAFVIYEAATGNAAKKKVQVAPLNSTYSVNFRDLIQFRSDDETRQRPIRRKP